MRLEWDLNESQSLGLSAMVARDWKFRREGAEMSPRRRWLRRVIADSIGKGLCVRRTRCELVIEVNGGRSRWLPSPSLPRGGQHFFISSPKAKLLS